MFSPRMVAAGGRGKWPEIRASSVPGALRTLSHLLFAAFLVLTLSTRSLWLRSNPSFDQPPMQRLAELVGSYDLHLLLSALTCCAWFTSRRLALPPRPWGWGSAPIALPILGLALLVLARTDLASEQPGVAQIPKLLAFSALVYLFILNEQPKILPPLALAVLCQSTIGLLQFLTQGDLHLAVLGELPLNTNVDGISILWVDDRAWIRAYGLTDHPNLLGTLLAVSLLVLLGHEREVKGETSEQREASSEWRDVGFLAARLLLLASAGIGFLGLLATFSRAAWLGLLAGLLVLWPWDRTGAASGAENTTRSRGSRGPREVSSRYILRRRTLWLAALLLVAAVLLFPYRDLFGARLLITDSPVETRSVYERLRDARLALDLVASHPLLGVGPGRYDEAARVLDPKALTVHDVPLLVAAELGLPAAALWLWLAVYPFLRRAATLDSSLAPWAAWVVNGLFDPNPWPLSMLSSAVLFGILAAGLAGGRRKPVRDVRSGSA